MTMNALRALALALCLAVLGTPAADASIYIVPTDRDLVHQSDDVVIATGVASTIERDPRGAIVTRYTLQIDEVLKGRRSAGDPLVLTERGGVLGNQARVIFGTPEYLPGVQYLIFTSADRDLEPTTRGMSMGQFRLIAENGRTLAIRSGIDGFDAQSMDGHVELARDARRFAAFIRDVVAGLTNSDDYFVENARERQLAAEWKVAPNYTKTSYLWQDEGFGIRWETPRASLVRNGTHTPGSDGVESMRVALAQWNGAGAGVEYTDGGSDRWALAGLLSEDGRNAILFGDPNHELDGGATLAGILSEWDPREVGEEVFWLTTEVDVIIENMSFSQSCLNSVMTHSIGHTLGLRDSNADGLLGDEGPCDPHTQDCSADAIMTAPVECDFDGALRPWDYTAIQAVYGNGPTCEPPTITTQPQDQTISHRASATLSITSNGTEVKWFRGIVGDTSTQVASGPSFNTGALTSTTSYWAAVSNACGTVPSRKVTVTVSQTTDTVRLLDDRFTVQVRYRNQFENPPVEGKLLGRSLFSSSTSETAIFSFGDPLVVELMVRFSDARPWDDNVHFYFGGLSDVEFFISVLDSFTGVTKEYHKPAGELVGQVDRDTFPASASALQSGIAAMIRQTAAMAVSPLADSSTIRLLNGRYEVRMRYRNQFANPPTTGYLLGRSIASSSITETAIFYFDNAESVEWMVRFSDTRPFANRIDMYHGGMSDIEYTIEVTDTVTGIRKEYAKGPGSLEGYIDRVSFQP